MQGVGIRTGASRAHMQMRGRSGIQGDPGQRERHPRARFAVGAIPGDQRVQRGVEQRGMQRVAGDVGVGGQHDVGVHGVGIGRVVTNAHHPLEHRTVLQPDARQIVVETTHVDGLQPRQCPGCRSGDLLSTQRRARVQHPGAVVLLDTGARVHGHRSPTRLVDRVDSDLYIRRMLIDEHQRGVQDQLVDPRATHVTAGV
ncbi:hypothetical protein MSIMFB_03230 [Mycobacterium simulans]|uniref:Uncharacterized protein n=1 Tax=Mycobacterium simulans TaxID=627089 RepID=A0A7Z7INS1_9MYCO|nr:hypothetical protein MSIMFB_03230 [Mycobacterium simulans]